MEITEVRIKLMEDAGERLQAFCSITFDDCFVIRDLKIIEGANGPFVAMPSRKLTSHCPQCGCKNHLRAHYCNQCGVRSEGRPAIQRRRRPGQALRRYRPPDQLALPRNDPGARDPHVSGGTRTLATARLRFALRGFRRRCDPRAPFLDRQRRFGDRQHATDAIRPPQEAMPRKSASEQTKVQPAAQEPRPPHKTPSTQRTTRHDQGQSGFGAGNPVRKRGSGGRGEHVACRLSLSRGERSFRLRAPHGLIQKTPRRS